MRKTLYILLFLLLSATVFADNNTNSPYTRYGYGDISENTSGAQRALGGVSTAFRSNKVINPAQPASYTAADSTSFMFDFGVSGTFTSFRDNKGHNNTINANLEYLNMQIPMGKYFGLSLGIMPYSHVGYDFEQSGDSILIADEFTQNATYVCPTRSYTGSGGISEVYLGLAGEIAHHVSIGANIYYMWGTINNTRTITFSSSNWSTRNMNNALKISDFRLRYGIQAYHTFAQKHTITLGFAYENKKKLHGTFEQIETTTYDTLTLNSSSFDLPSYYSGGISYNYDKRLSINFDYAMREWEKAAYYGVKDSLKNTQRYSLGISYRNNPYSKKYVDRVEWRMGGYMTNSYLKQDATKNFGISFGVGLPLKNSNSMVNAAFEYNHRGSSSVLKENQYKLTINANFCENWFFRKRIKNK